MVKKARTAEREAVPRRSARWPRKRRHLLGSAYLLLLVGCALLLVSLSLTPAPVPTSPRQTLVVGSLPFWNIGGGTETLVSHRESVNGVSPWMYGIGPNGEITTQYPPEDSDKVKRNLSRLRDAGLPVMPTLANITKGRWAYEPVARMLHDPESMRRHVAGIVSLVQREGYNGIDIDYEDLRARDRDAFTRFITLLAERLHAVDKKLSVALFAKSTNAGYDERNVAQDYAAIGRVADQVRLMGYDYHWSTSEPGAVAPVGWIRDVLDYAKTRIPRDKIVLGVPLYGYDWVGGHGESVTWLEAFRLATEHGAKVRYDRDDQAPWFRYTDEKGREHEVWFENAASSRAKFEAARAAGIRGVYLWMYGHEDVGMWPALRDTLPVG